MNINPSIGTTTDKIDNKTITWNIEILNAQETATLKYKKKLRYTDNKFPTEQNIYYKPGKPRKSIAETETKFGFMYIMAWFCIPFSIFFGIPISSWVITGIIIMGRLFSVCNCFRRK